MGSETVYLSAPCDLRGAGQADMAWEEMRPFQPLLGQDAQMAGFAAAARADGVQVRVLAAPEIYGSGVGLHRSLAQGGDRVLAHVRFGPPRLPRILKRAVNAIVLAEDTTIPASLGRHPFAAGAALPACVESVFVYDRSTPMPERIGVGPASCVVLPPDLAISDLSVAVEDGPRGSVLGEIVLQTFAQYRETAWHRWAARAPCETAIETLTRRTAVLLPWNLAAPGSLVPDVLEKASFLAAQGCFPLTLVVLPYNDVPRSLAALEEVAASCARHRARPSDDLAILLARAGSIRESLALLKLCRRVWIDATDPEWRWTLRRVGGLGLPANFISALPSDVAGGHDPGPYAADALMTRQSDNRFGSLFWRTRVLSSRRLGELADAVDGGVDVPFGPMMTEPPGPAARRTVQDLLRPVTCVAHA